MTIEIEPLAYSDERIDDLGVDVVAFAQNSDGSGWSLSFERSFAPTAQDKELNQDSYAITDESGVTFYDGVLSLSLESKSLSLELSPACADVLRTDATIVLRLPTTEEAARIYGALRALLRMP